jgi:hypothetical protein
MGINLKNFKNGKQMRTSHTPKPNRKALHTGIYFF